MIALINGAVVDLFKVALAHHQAGQLDEAKQSYLELLKADPLHWAALANLGVLCLHGAVTGSEDFERGVGCLHHSLSVNPNQASVHNNLANALSATGDVKQSDAHYAMAIALAPDYLEAYINRALLLKKAYGLKQARVWLEEHESKFSDQARFYQALGAVLMDSGAHEHSLLAFDRVIALYPSSAQAWYDRGNALRLLNRFDECLTNYRHALRLDPNIAEAWVNMGVTEQNLKHFDEAITCYNAALRLRPDSINATYNRALSLENTWRFPEAIEAFKRALLLSPNYPYLLGRIHHAKMLVCDWSDYLDRLNKVIELVHSGAQASVPFPFLAMTGDTQLQLRCSRTYVEDKCPAVPNAWAPCSYDGKRRIRIGYFSADFRTHAVGFLTTGMFEAHDRNHFEVFAISLGIASDGDIYRDRIATGVEHFVDASRMMDSEVIGMVRALELDVAVDLAGHTMDARTGIFAQRVARWQLNYLGFPGSMGASYMDVILADHTVVPQEFECFYSERVVRLPNTFQINDRQRALGQHKPRELYGLPEHGLVLASFNTSYKLNPPTFDIWCRLLERSPKCVLWLLGENDTQMKNLRQEAKARGVDPQRLVFADRVPYEDHLVRYCHVDLVLDTFPFNGGTSTSDALWGGAPVLTCMGKAFAARMSASLLNAVGLSELVTTSAANYEQLARKLIDDPVKLEELKRKLEISRNECSLFDTVGQTRALEGAYRVLLGAI